MVFVINKIASANTRPNEPRIVTAVLHRYLYMHVMSLHANHMIQFDTALRWSA